MKFMMNCHLKSHNEFLLNISIHSLLRNYRYNKRSMQNITEHVIKTKIGKLSYDALADSRNFTIQSLRIQINILTLHFLPKGKIDVSHV